VCEEHSTAEGFLHRGVVARLGHDDDTVAEVRHEPAHLQATSEERDEKRREEKGRE
jgi:hypothetical protein